MKPQQKKILTTAVKIFSKKGFHQATMDEIAQAANVAKGTLYYNYASKSDLFRAAVTDGVDVIIGQIRDALSLDLPFHQHLRKLVAQNIALYLKYSDLTRIVFNELTSGIDDRVLKEIATVRERYLGFIADQLALGQAQGYIRPVDLRLAAVGVVGLVEHLCAYHLNNRRQFPRKQIEELVYTLLVDGLCIDKRSESQATQ